MKIKTQGNYWTANEIAVNALERTGKTPTVTVAAGEIELTFREELPQNEINDLITYFGAVHDLPDVNEKAAKEARRVELRSKVAKVKDEKLSLSELREVVLALAELMGGLYGD